MSLLDAERRAVECIQCGRTAELGHICNACLPPPVPDRRPRRLAPEMNAWVCDVAKRKLEERRAARRRAATSP